MTKKKFQRLFMRNSCFVMFMAFGLSLLAGSFASAGHFISCHHAESLSLKGALEHQMAVDPEGAQNKQAD